MDAGAFVYPLVASIVFLTTVFFIARYKDRYDLVDAAWGMTFIGIALVSYTGQKDLQLFSVQTLVLVLVAIWGLRLAYHIYHRWEYSEYEDKRYQNLRNQYKLLPGGLGINMYVRVFLVQAILAFVVCLPVIILNMAHALQFSWLSILGLLVWSIGFCFESVGDAQLAKYLHETKGKNKLMTTGLWKYTRHPNYFGEVSQWWGIFIIVLAMPYWWIAIIGPVAITVLIFSVSGVPLTEKHFEGRPGWDKYVRQTSKFLPLPPKKG
ncbi:MAG: hypothetical protein JWN75_605 [Candidatus Saccharibacteria bacterium]|nr:hypothetical protein [Candidatus Saccharibacteria bacterium]